MAIKFTEKNIETITGDFTTETPYEIIEKKDSSYILEADAGGEKVKLTVNLLDQGYMQILSESSSEMNYYIWERKY